MAYQATNNRTMSSLKSSSSQYIKVSRPRGMGNNVLYVGKRCDSNSTEIFRHYVNNNKLCIEEIYELLEIEKLKIEKAKHPDGMLKKRSDIGPGYYEASKLSIIRRIVCNVADNEIALQERENNVEHEDQQETQNKKQKTTHKEATNKVSIEFTMSEPAIFTTGKVTVKTAGTKRTIYPQQKN
jgi:hypothetical protein